MLFKIINKDKVKILIEKEDVLFTYYKENYITCVAELLISIYKNTGIDFTNSKIMIEVVNGESDTYYIIITRISSSKEKTDENEVDMYIFKITQPERLFNMVSVINRKSVNIKKSELYEYKNEMYFCIYVLNDDAYAQEELIDELEKNVPRCRWNIISDSILKEWGRLISDNIIEEITATKE